MNDGTTRLNEALDTVEWQGRLVSPERNGEPKRGTGILDNRRGNQLIVSLRPSPAHRTGGLTLRNGVRWGPAARSASLAYGALRRENRTPDDVIIRWSAAAADRHFKVLIVIEPNLDRVWAALMAGAQPGLTPFTVVQLAISGLDDAPKVRSVILRSADAERGAVSFSTDLRSAKIKEMRRQPRVSLIGYDADAGFQIRLEGKAAIERPRRVGSSASWI